MTLISERATLMPNMSTSVGVNSQYPFQIFSPPSMADNNLTLPAAKSTQVPQAERLAIGNKETGATGGTSLNVTSHSSSTSSWLTNIGFTEEILHEENWEKLKSQNSYKIYVRGKENSIRPCWQTIKMRQHGKCKRLGTGCTCTGTSKRSGSVKSS